jgi:hypothetical protein
LITRLIAATLITLAGTLSWSAHAAPAAPAGLPACSVTLPSGSINSTDLRLKNGEVLCVSGTFTNNGTISAPADTSSVVEASSLVNDGLVKAGPGATLQLTDLPANLENETLNGGAWFAAGTIKVPDAVSTLAAKLTLSGNGEIEDSTTSDNAVDTLSSISQNGTLILDDSAYLATGSVTAAGTIRLGTEGDADDAVNWQGAGTFTMTGGSFTFLDPNACINVGNRAFTVTGGTVRGFGMLTGSVTVSGSAVFAPTLQGSQASFWLNGSYTQTGGEFEDTVNNPSGTPSAGSLWAADAVSLGGQLKVISTGTRPAAGTSLSILSGGSVDGQFETVRSVGVAGWTSSNDGSTGSIIAMSSAPPAAPRNPNAVASGPGQATISWTGPASNGGKAVTGYTVLAAPKCACTGMTVGGKALSTTVGGLSGGTSYTFRVEAHNAIGTGVPSVATASIDE